MISAGIQPSAAGGGFAVRLRGVTKVYDSGVAALGPLGVVRTGNVG